MKPISLNLKGFKGIRSKTGMGEYSLDLTGLSGLVAIIGPNGAGKTTVLDNLHPYRIMPYRSGSYSPRSFSFYPHCHGRDASKELVFEMNSNLYRSLILIDSEKKKQEAYLFVKNGDWQPLCDGKVESYDKCINSLLGSPQMFFTSVFRCQDAVKISDYTKGEIKDLFVELLNIEDLKQFGLQAKEVKNTLLSRLEHMKAESNILNKDISMANEASKEADKYREELDLLTKEVQQIETLIQEKQSELQEVKSQVAIHENNLKEKETITAELEANRKIIEKYQKIAAISSDIRAANETEKRLTSEVEALRRENSKVESVITNLHKIFSDKKEIEKEIAEKEKSLSELSIKRKHNSDTVRAEITKAQNTKLLLQKVPCDSETHRKCLLLDDAVKAKNSLAVLVPKLHKLKNESPAEKKIREEIELLRKDLHALSTIEARLEVTNKEKQDLKSKIDSREKEIEKHVALSKLLPELVLAEKVLPNFKATLQRLEKKITSIKTDSKFKEKEAEVLKALEKLKSDIKNSVDRISDVRQTLGSMEALINKGDEASRRIKDVNVKISALNVDISEWAILEKAFSNDGIIALEIDDAGPAISATANDLLYTCFGPRFSVRIDTQVAKSSGKGLKETFDIIILDSERNEKKSLHTMSGGEKTWIEEAVTRAISLYNASKANIRYQSIFTDEKDGSLDHQKKKEFMAMKSKVLELGNYDMELFISQSPEIQEIADHTLTIGR